MDLHNNATGIHLYQSGMTDAQLSQAAWNAVQTGQCWYLRPALQQPFFPNGIPNPNGDPCYWGCAGNPLGTHGITSATKTTPTNQ